MVSAAGEAIEEEGAPAGRQRWGWRRWLLSGIGGVLLLIAVLLAALDTPPGRRFLIDQIEGMRPANGLRIRIGRIDGSIYGRMTISDLRLYDPEGLFFEAPRLEVDWQPLAYLFANRVHLDSLGSEFVILHKLPELIPSEEPQPILPGFDVHVGALDIRRFRFGEPIAGEVRDAALAGNADVRRGRANVDLRGRALDGGDRFVLDLDVEPDGDIFDIDLQLYAPEDGIIAGLSGIERALTVDIAGEGTWSRWDGRAYVDSGEARVMALDLDVREGDYVLGGTVRTGPLFDPGVVTRLTAPEVRISAAASLEDRLLDGSFTIRSAAALIEGRGGLDLGQGAFDGFVADVRLLDPSALARDMRGRDVALELRLDGPIASAGFGYRLSAASAAFGSTGFEEVTVEGEGRLSETPFTLPLTARARRMTGVDSAYADVLDNVRIDGAIMVTDNQIVGDDLVIRSDRLRGTASAIYDLATGDYAVGLNADIDRYALTGVGIVDISTRLDIRPGRGGRFVIAGRAVATTRRLDNAMLRDLTQGLPVLEANIAYGPGGPFAFTDARLRSPGVNFVGNGRINNDGTLQLSGSGNSAQYGAFDLAASGAPLRPHVELALANPLPSAGIADVRAELDPAEGGFVYAVTGESLAGPFTSNGSILLPSGAPVTVSVGELRVADTLSSGDIMFAEEGMVGTLTMTGDGIDGEIALQPVNGVQQVTADLDAEEARLGGNIATTIRRGMLDLQVLLYEDGPEINGTIDAFGVRRQGLAIARIEAGAQMRGRTGTATVSVAGSRGHDFEFAAEADITPQEIAINGGGEFEGEPITLTPLRLVDTGDGWMIPESTIEYAGGGATVSGRFGGGGTTLDATLDAIPLSAVGIFFPNAGLGGNITGTISYRLPEGETLPQADVAIRVRSLTREGFALQPRPVNLGLNGRLAGNTLAARAIMEGEGQDIMRAQVRLDPVPGGDSLRQRLYAAPLFAELRYSGPGETLWQLTGNETLSLSGPMIGRADVVGSLNDPDITGSVRTVDGRVESALTGTVIEGITTQGTFDGSSFHLPEFAGTTPGGGTITGSARFDLAFRTGLTMDVRLQAENAWLLRRDDIEARVTGPVSISLQAPPGANEDEDARPVGSIEGDLQLNEGLFALGQAAPEASIPRLNVIEFNRPLDEAFEPPPPIEWTISVDVDADNRFLVRGLGLDSEWSADLEVRGSLAAMQIYGDMNLVRGAYEFAGRRFELDRGSIDFYGRSPIDPTLDIVARGNTEGIDATITIGGTSNDPQIVFTSNPALPQSELLSRMLFGTSITNLSAPEALQLGVAVASLQGGGGGGLNPINAVRDAIGLDRLRIVPADPTQDRSTAVAAGVYVTSDLYVEVITDGQGYSATQAEFQVTRWLSLLSSISSIGRASASVEISRDY